MPVTAKFSKEFYDRLGHNIADELVDWFNAVDTVYRSEFRELFEVNFARLDAKLEQRTAELRQEMTELRAGLREEIAATKADLRQEIGDATMEVRREMVDMRTELRQEMNTLEKTLTERMATLETRLLRWSFMFGIAALGAIAGMIRLLG